MPGATEPAFLFLGSSVEEGTVNRLKAVGVPYRQKRLDSRVSNWEVIISLLESPSLKGVVVKLNARAYDLLTRENYATVAEQLMQHLSSLPHVVFVHDSLFSGGDSLPEEPEDEDDEDAYYDDRYRWHFGPPPPDDIRAAVEQLLERHRINVLPYQTNAELSVLASAFVDDHERDLLFRMYVPTGRLYSDEADRLVTLFRDWLSKVKGQAVRQDGYKTPAGQVYEFFGDNATGTDLAVQFADFSSFLDLCVDEPSGAVAQLETNGISKAASESIVSRYGREAKRLSLDLKHARETRLLELQHSLESELLDTVESATSSEIEAVLTRLLPLPSAGSPLASLAPTGGGTLSVNISQQFVQTAEAIVTQNVQGTVNLGPQAHELLALIAQFGEGDAAQLESAVHELEDADARQADRLRARQRLKGFLTKLGGKVEETALTVLQRYLESKLGL